jgi:hypothetical protein
MVESLQPEKYWFVNRLFVVLFVSIATQALSGQSFQFVGEKIDFSLNKERFSINGIYYFVNGTETAINRTILFPFSTRADSLSVKRVFNLTYFENIRFQEAGKDITFDVYIRPKDTVAVNIAYSQKTSTENVYILESTQAWGKALKWAQYSLQHDASVTIDRLSIAPDSMSQGIRYWNKVDFFPKENFTVWINR